jgi:peptide/nickel transport system substrate-binding protein
MRRSRQRSLVLAAVAVTGALVAGCSSGTGSDTAGSADTDARLTMAIPAQPPNLDPDVSTTTATSDIANGVLETLLTTDEKQQVQPMLAASYDVSEDGKTYTFTLRDGVKFHDDSDFDAQDVVASMERWSRLSGPGQTYFDGATWKTVDERTVRVDLKTPTFGALLALANPNEQFAAIYPSEVIAAATDEPITDIVGTGPFRLGEWIPDQSLALNRFDGYVPADGEPNGRAGNRTAEVAGIDFKFVPDPATRVLGLQTGEYDFISEVPYDNAAQVLSDSSLKASSYPVTLLNLYYNKAQGPFADVTARRAVDTALDRDAIMLAAVSDRQFYTLTNSMMLDAQSGLWPTAVGKDTFNPHDTTKARQLLADSGYNGAPVRIIATRDYLESYNAAVVVQEELKGIGIDASLDTYDWPTFTEVRDDPTKWELAVIPNTAKSDPGSLVFMRPDFAGSTKSPQLDAILETYRAAPTLEEARSHYDDLQRWFYDYLPVSKLGDADTVFATTTNVDVTVGPGFEGPILWRTTVTK